MTDIGRVTILITTKASPSLAGEQTNMNFDYDYYFILYCKLSYFSFHESYSTSLIFEGVE